MTYTIKQNPQDFIVKENIPHTPKEKGKYSLLLLKKTKYNTEDAIKKVTQATQTKRNQYSVAGYKDRNAYTEQYITVKNEDNKTYQDLHIKDITIKPQGYIDTPLSLGDHTSNTFTIIIRNAQRTPQTPSTIKNYFDTQRFSSNNHIIGKHLVTKNFKAATNLLQQDHYHKRPINRHLKDHKNDYVTALQTLPKGLLKLFVHAYQSQLWNRSAQRLQPLPKTLPLIGFDTKPDTTQKRKEIRKTLQEENISKRDFIIKQIPYLTTEGTTRKTMLTPQNLTIKQIDDQTIKTTFTLKPGEYATMVIKHIMNNVTIQT